MDDLAVQAYDAYNAGGSDPAFVNRNFRGDLCPTWGELPLNVRQKWEAAVAAVAAVLLPASVANDDNEGG